MFCGHFCLKLRQAHMLCISAWPSGLAFSLGVFTQHFRRVFSHSLFAGTVRPLVGLTSDLSCCGHLACSYLCQMLYADTEQAPTLLVCTTPTPVDEHASNSRVELSKIIRKQAACLIKATCIIKLPAILTLYRSVHICQACHHHCCTSLLQEVQLRTSQV